ncbi:MULTISPECIES: hypothetical protein [Thermomonospora]|uniref:Spore-associated protein A n=1 Tax=Thermomonospora cellulosilytica TaxID=1411118 RepID=A0A7W3MTY1_9ACTN|nr:MULTISPECIES: hypothetical protein [Thermomonospora]MBA9001834.1 hypothetical protein [Thermomonospora cellulosilytica]
MRAGKALTGAITAVATAGAVLALTPAAQAAANPYTPTGVCGSGYYVVDSATLRNSAGNAGGTLYLLYNGSNGYNCVVTIKGVAVGDWTATYASLRVYDGNAFRMQEDGPKLYEYYAGPVKMYAAGKCVGASGHTWGGGTQYSATIPKGHCG